MANTMRLETVAHETHRPVVCLMNKVEHIRDIQPNAAFLYGHHRFQAQQVEYFTWAPGASALETIDEQSSDIPAYLSREIEMILEIEGVPVLLNMSDDPAREEAPAEITPPQGITWRRSDKARLSLLFGTTIDDGYPEPCLVIPVQRASLK